MWWNWTKQKDIDYCNNIYDFISSKIENKEPYSLVRLGDGELSILEQGYIHTPEEINKMFWYSNSYVYCGVKVPDLLMRNRMIRGIKDATQVGIIHGDPRFDEFFKAIDFFPKDTLQSTLCLDLPMKKGFIDLLRKYPPLLVGRSSEYYKCKLKQILGIEVAGTVDLQDVRNLSESMDKMLKIDHSWSLVCAGCNSIVVCSVMSNLGKISIDFGHAFDNALIDTDEKGNKLKPEWAEWYINKD